MNQFVNKKMVVVSALLLLSVFFDALVTFISYLFYYLFDLQIELWYLVGIGSTIGSGLILSGAYYYWTTDFVELNSCEEKFIGIRLMSGFVFLAAIYAGVLSISSPLVEVVFLRRFGLIDECSCGNTLIRNWKLFFDMVVILGISEEIFFRSMFMELLERTRLGTKKINFIQAILNSLIYLVAAPVYFVLFFVLQKFYPGNQNLRKRIIVRLGTTTCLYALVTSLNSLYYAEAGFQQMILVWFIFSAFMYLVVNGVVFLIQLRK